MKSFVAKGVAFSDTPELITEDESPAEETGYAKTPDGNTSGTCPKAEADAVALSIQGHSYESIAKQLGFSNPSLAWTVVQRGLKRRLTDQQSMALERELAVLDVMLQGLMPKASTGDALAVEKVLRVHERRRKLLGISDDMMLPGIQHEDMATAGDATGVTSIDEIRRVHAQRSAAG